MYDEAVKRRARELDPECWVSYSGKSKEFKSYMDVRRRAALEKARREWREGCEFRDPRLKDVLDNKSLQMLLAVTLDKLAELCHRVPGADDFTEQLHPL